MVRSMPNINYRRPPVAFISDAPNGMSGILRHRDFQHCEPLTGSSLKTVELLLKTKASPAFVGRFQRQ